MNNNDRNHRGPRRDSQNHRRTAADALPPPELLESYNYVVEGSAKKILEMFEREQSHRHKWENKALRVHLASTVLGQLLGFMVAISIFAAAGVIGIYGNMAVAGAVWVFGIAIIVMAGMVWMYAKSMGQRPLFARPAMRAHFRPEKEAAEE